MKTVVSTASAVMMIMSFVLPVSAFAEGYDSSALRNESWSSQRVISTFMNTGGTTSTSFDNDGLSSSAFDFAALFSHPCYEPIGAFLSESCDRRFGVYGNLKNGLKTSGLRNALVFKFGSGILDLIGSANTDLAESEAEEAQQEAEDDAVVNFYGDFRERRIQLWDICQERFSVNPAACYQDNIRLLGESQITISGNVNHRVSTSR